MKVLIFGGTTEGRVLAAALGERHQVTVSVATALGGEALAGIPDISVLTGRLDRDAMEKLLRGFDLCVDATHPYAREATENIREACGAAGVPLRRLLRRESETEGTVRVESAAAAAAYLSERPGRVLLTTGAKELPAFRALDPERLYARVLPTHEALYACEALGLPHSHILALQGPFSGALNGAILDQYGIEFLVTKDGGKAGGFAEKLEAARQRQIPVVLISRPRETGEDLETLIAELEAMA